MKQYLECLIRIRGDVEIVVDNQLSQFLNNLQVKHAINQFLYYLRR
jgi:hypothetical protein